MNEFKTLKDLEILRRGKKREDTEQTNFYDIIQIGEYQTICYPEQLKQEAIKWINKCNSASHLIIDSEQEAYLPSDKLLGVKCNNSIALWIRHFFNITDEELK